MIEVLLFLLIGLQLVSAVVLAVVLKRELGSKFLAVENGFTTLDKELERVERAVHDEVATNRSEFSGSMRSFTDSILSRLFEIGGSQKDQIDILVRQISEQSKSTEDRLGNFRDTLDTKMNSLQSENSLNSKQSRDEISNSLKLLQDSLLSRMAEITGLQKGQLDNFAGQIAELTKTAEERLDKIRDTMNERIRALQEAGNLNSKQSREEISKSLKEQQDSLVSVLDRLRGTIDEKLKSLQDDNGKRLEEMRATVDEKLHATLEQRLGQSFQLVSERLELVHKGLGEMQTLASGVGDLKKVLTNVRARGAWGEVQLATLLEQMLTRDQYFENVVTKNGSNERVEFAIRLPGQRGPNGAEVLLPIDAKFPIEDYQRLIDAQDRGDADAIETAQKQLQRQIKIAAKNIKDKYLDPPNTTDFALMFLPIEGLYAEVLRAPGLCESIQRECRVIVTGPTTLAAIMNSLQMGFRTLAIEKRSSEVWNLLGAVKTEFGKFGDILEKTHKKLQEASNTIDDASRKSRTIERKLRQVQYVPTLDGQSLLGESEAANGLTENDQ